MGEHPLTGLVIEGLRRQLDASGRWMAWNLVLALAPWLLSLVLFRRERRPGWAWFAGLGAWVLLIPNAAYVLTDVVHLPAAVRREPSDALVLLVVFPLYVAFFAVGFTAYADALRRLRRHVTAQGWLRRPWTVELGVHAATAVGIYLGRIHRFNSWDVARQPFALLDTLAAGFTRPAAIAGIAVAFAALTIGQAITNPILDRLAPVVRRSPGRSRDLEA
jgi:uncharacterized membrane protein